MWYLAKVLQESIARRKNQIFCERCGLLYEMTALECPRCTGVSDRQLVALLKRRKGFRVTLSRLMYLGVIVLMVAIFALRLIP